MELQDAGTLLGEEYYQSIERVYIEESARQIRCCLLQLKLIDDLQERSRKLGDIMAELGPSASCQLLQSAYRRVRLYSPIGEATLLSALQLDVIWQDQGIVLLQGIFDELQSGRQYELSHLLIDALIFRKSSRVFCELTLHFQQTIAQFYERTSDKRFHLDMYHIIRRLQNLCKNQGLRTIKLEIDQFFHSFFRVEITDEIIERLLPILFAKKFHHYHGKTLVLETEELLPPDQSSELLPTLFDVDVDSASWEMVLSDPIITPDDIVIEARKWFDHLRTGDRVAIARKVKGTDLKLLLYDPSPVVLGALLENPRLTEVDVGRIASRHTTSPELLETFGQRGNWIYRHPIKNALAKNPNTRFEQASKYLPDLLQQDLIEIIQQTDLSWSLRRAAYQELWRRIRDRSLPEQIGMSEFASPIITDALLKMRDQRIVSTLLYYGRLEEAQISRVVRFSFLDGLILEQIGKSHYWSEIPEVRIGLLHHPNCPPAIKSRFLDDLTRDEMVFLSHNPELDSQFSKVIKNRLQKKNAI